MGSSYFLFARPTLISGMATVLDIGATLMLYNESKIPREADYRALKCDWETVGEDIATAIAQFEQEINVQAKAK